MPDTIITGLSTRSRRAVQSTGAWTCPTCGTENLGPLEAGCPACGAGRDATRAKGAPPPADAPAARLARLDPATVNMEAFHEAIEALAAAEKTEGALAMYAAYRESLKRIPLRQEEMVRASFLAGAVWMREKLKLLGGPRHEAVGGGTTDPGSAPAGAGGSASGDSLQPHLPNAEDPPVGGAGSPGQHDLGAGEGCNLLLYVEGDAAPTFLPPEAQTTIIAALTFYVENQLAYGPVEGQLSPSAVRDLVRRLLPKPEEGA